MRNVYPMPIDIRHSQDERFIFGAPILGGFLGGVLGGLLVSPRPQCQNCQQFPPNFGPMGPNYIGPNFVAPPMQMPMPMMQQPMPMMQQPMPMMQQPMPMMQQPMPMMQQPMPMMQQPIPYTEVQVVEVNY